MKNERSKEIEIELLSRLFTSTEKIPEAYSRISEDDFQHYGKAYSVLVSAYLGNKNIISEITKNRIKANLFTKDSFRDVRAICRDLKDISNGIRLEKILISNAREVPEENVSVFAGSIQKQILDAVKSTEHERSDINSIIEDWRLKKIDYTQRYQNGDQIMGLSTGFKKLDRVIDGLRKEHLWVVGGYTNTGKTFASLNIVKKLIEDGHRVVFYSLEMGSTDILSRLIGLMAQVNGNSIMKGFGDEEKTEEVIRKIALSNLSIHTNKSSLEEIEYSMYEENIKNPVALFVIDFVQLVTVKNAKSEYETITTSALSFQQTAKRLKSTVMLLSQISNDGAKNVNEVVMSFKGSGALGAAADLAIEISIGEDDKTEWKRKLFAGEPVEMKWSIKKNRHGSVGVIPMNFTGKTGLFKESIELEDI